MTSAEKFQDRVLRLGANFQQLKMRSPTPGFVMRPGSRGHTIDLAPARPVQEARRPDFVGLDWEVEIEDVFGGETRHGYGLLRIGFPYIEDDTTKFSPAGGSVPILVQKFTNSIGYRVQGQLGVVVGEQAFAGEYYSGTGDAMSLSLPYIKGESTTPEPAGYIWGPGEVAFPKASDLSSDAFTVTGTSSIYGWDDVDGNQHIYSLDEFLAGVSFDSREYDPESTSYTAGTVRLVAYPSLFYFEDWPGLESYLSP